MTTLRTTLSCAGAVLLSCAGEPTGDSDRPVAALAEGRPAAAVEKRLAPETWELLGYAGRASSSHNAQPWRIEPAGPGTLKLLAEPSRYLPAVDPTHREMFLSFGAFLETFDQAAAGLGYEATITVTADSKDAAEIATIRLTRTGVRRGTATLNLIAGVYTPKGDFAAEPLARETCRTLGGGEPVQFILRTGRLQRELPDFAPDAVTSATIRMRPEQFVSVR